MYPEHASFLRVDATPIPSGGFSINLLQSPNTCLMYLRSTHVKLAGYQVRRSIASSHKYVTTSPPDPHLQTSANDVHSLPIDLLLLPLFSSFPFFLRPTPIRSLSLPRRNIPHRIPEMLYHPHQLEYLSPSR